MCCFYSDFSSSGERLRQVIAEIPTALAERVVRRAAEGVGQAGLEVADVALVGVGDFGDLVCIVESVFAFF